MNKIKVAALHIRTPDLRQTLLLNRNREPYKGYWSLPAGKIKAKESPEAAAVRELREETGIEAEITPPAAFASESVYENNRKIFDFDIYYFNFFADIEDPKPESDEGELRWFYDSLLRGRGIIPSDAMMMQVLDDKEYKRRRISVVKEGLVYRLGSFVTLEDWR